MSARDFGADRYVSTGVLPSSDVTGDFVREAYSRYESVEEGSVSQVYPALAQANPFGFGICLAGTSGKVWEVGDSGVEFPIMSVVKPFVFALMCQLNGASQIQDLIGVNSTGLPFNSVEAVERIPDGRTNPMVNAGAIATMSLAPGSTLEDKWSVVYAELCSFAGRELHLMDDVLESARSSNFRNREIVSALVAKKRLYCDADDALELYTRACSLAVSARDLAFMGAVLANGGLNMLTELNVVDLQTCRYTLAVMVTAGMYETSGDWLYQTGLPGKSGIGGGIVTIAPGKGALGTWAPPLDGAGNSVKGQRVAIDLSQKLGLDLFVSKHR